MCVWCVFIVFFMHRFLQVPSEDKPNTKELSLKFAIDTIDMIEQYQSHHGVTTATIAQHLVINQTLRYALGK